MAESLRWSLETTWCKVNIQRSGRSESSSWDKGCHIGEVLRPATTGSVTWVSGDMQRWAWRLHQRCVCVVVRCIDNPGVAGSCISPEAGLLSICLVSVEYDSSIPVVWLEVCVCFTFHVWETGEGAKDITLKSGRAQGLKGMKTEDRSVGWRKWVSFYLLLSVPTQAWDRGSDPHRSLEKCLQDKVWFCKRLVYVPLSFC